jgi:hypothetical protein
MNFALDNPVLLNDLDSQTFNILNCNTLTGADNVIYSVDPRMSDARNMINGTVTNDSVAATAGIIQSKLSLNGTIPTSWLGTTSTTAAEGDLAEFKSNRDQHNGYPSLNGSGKMPTGSVPTSGSGTVTQLAVSLPKEMITVPNTATAAWSFTGLWGAANPESFFGNISGGSATPGFNIEPLYLSLIPNLPASQFTSGTFDTDRLPVAVGVGGSHAIGIVPDPTLDDGTEYDYLARDMTFKQIDTPIPYQPMLPDPSITILYYVGPVAIVLVTESVKGANLFFQTLVAPAFSQIITPTVQVPIGEEVMVYAAKTGYNNSNIVKYTIPDPSLGP